MNKRKLLLVAIALCMVAILAVGGSLAYLTDDEQANNTMVIGNVQINIDEFTYENGKWKPFVDDEFTLYPIDNEQGFNLYNKMVHTFNTSPSEDAAYIRTIVLFEVNDELDSTFVGEGESCFPGLHFGYNDVIGPQTGSDKKQYYGSTNYDLEDPVEIAGEKYWVVVFTVADNKTAIPYDACLNTLSSVWVDKNVNSEQMLGWKDETDLNGGQVSILVFSQGIQAEGLTHAEAMAALGEVNQDSLIEWLTDEDGNLKGQDAKINDYSTK